MDEKRVFIIMMTLVAVIIAIILAEIWLNPAAAEEDQYFILCRPGSHVNVRKRPTKGAPVTAWVECGQQITVDRRKNGFVHVIGLASEEPDGWIFAGYVVDEQPQVREYLAHIWDGDVIARSSVGGRALRTMREGQTVTVYAKTHIWAVTNRGYILCDWLKEVE